MRECIVTFSKIFWQRYFLILVKIAPENCKGYQITSFSEVKFVKRFITFIVTFITIPPPLPRWGDIYAK